MNSRITQIGYIDIWIVYSVNSGTSVVYYTHLHFGNVLTITSLVVLYSEA